MAASFHESPFLSIFSPAPSFTFHDLPQIEVLESVSYHEARMEMQLREATFGPAWFLHNGEMAQAAWQRHKPWWLF